MVLLDVVALSFEWAAGGRWSRHSSQGTMKYLGSTRGAVITDKEVARSQRRRKLVRGLLLGGVLHGGGAGWESLCSDCFSRLQAVDSVGLGAGAPRAVMTAHAQRK